MKEINGSKMRFILIFTLIMILNVNGTSQTTMPDVLIKNTLEEQMKYIQERTRIYESYRAIREDIFQKIKENALDSLSAAKIEIIGLENLKIKLNHTIDSINSSFETTKNKLDETTRTKNSIRLFGLVVNKFTYNSVMWTIIVGLIALLLIGYLAFKRNLSVTVYTKKELKELKEEFEAYRKSSREAREKMSMDHFNELKKLRGG